MNSKKERYEYEQDSIRNESTEELVDDIRLQFESNELEREAGIKEGQYIHPATVSEVIARTISGN